MTIDTTMLTETSMKYLDALEKTDRYDDCKIVAVGIVVALENDDKVYTKTYTSDNVHYRKVGLWTQALETVKHGVPADDE